MRKSIEVVVNPKGEVKVETKGFTGASCRAASQAFEEALGIKAAERTTAEFYQPTTTAATQQLKA